MKIDLHVHSKYSRRPSEWILKTLGCPESFTEPLTVYSAAKKAGMTHVTLTDHNTISGCLELMEKHPEDTFISEEVTTYFTWDRCKLHVLVYNITEQEHAEIQRIRNDVFELIPWLRDHNIVHSLAHPLYSINKRLSPEHFEKCLLLFDNFELNGARNEAQNNILKLILSQLTKKTMLKFAEKHGIEPHGRNFWAKRFTSGSDDHGSLSIASKYTEVPAAMNYTEYFSQLEYGGGIPQGCDSHPQKLAHTMYSIAYQFYRRKYDLDSFLSNDVIAEFLDNHLTTDSQTRSSLSAKISYLWNTRKRTKPNADTPLLSLLRNETHYYIADQQNGHTELLGNNEDLSANWFNFVEKISNKAILQFTDNLIQSFINADLVNLFGSLGSAGALYSVLAPYFVSYGVFAEDRLNARKILEDVTGHRVPSERNTAHFTDTLFEVNGVAQSLKRLIRQAVVQQKKYTIITCNNENCPTEDGIEQFKPSGVYTLPIYPEQKLFFPPFLKMLNFCYEKQFTNIHVATPGPIGIAGLLISKILGLPIAGTYHTALPQYADHLVDDPSITEMMWKYVIWFYDQMDTIYVSSQATLDELCSKGISPRKIKFWKRDVDVVRFHPHKAKDDWSRYPRVGCDDLKILYVGRISKEKNLATLINAFRKLLLDFPHVHLLFVGDGPQRQEMQESLKDDPVTFTGYLRGDELSSIYASCDLFVFPSTTDTFGNVILEAQASGLPVIVTDKGGPQENVVPGVTGLITKSHDEDSLKEALTFLLSDPARMKAMGEAARKLMETRAAEIGFHFEESSYAEDLTVQQKSA